MGLVAGKSLRATEKNVQGVGSEAGAEITDPRLWCENFVQHDFDKAKQAFDASTSEQQACIIELLGGDDACMDEQAALEARFGELDDGECADVMNGLK